MRFLLLVVALNSVRCANILGVFPSPGYSQFILAEKLMSNLAKRGHNVTVISAFEPKEDIENYTTIVMESLVKDTESNMLHLEREGIFGNTISTYQFGYFLTNYMLSHKSVKNLINSNTTTFDLVILEQFFNEAHMGFSSHFNAPLVLFSSIGLTEWNGYLVGNLNLPSITPFSFSSLTSRMKFFQRVANTILYMFDVFYKEFVIYPQHQTLLSKSFPKEMVLKDIMYNASLMLLNSHASVNEPCILNSAMVEIGGFHITSRKLPNDLQEFLDSATEGAVLFSLGSNLKSSYLPAEQLGVILKDLARMKQKVLWKFEADGIPFKPDNVLISKWLPQNDILGHPNTVAFITHGGLLSVTEAAFHGVPMIAIPVFGDQKMNVARLVQNDVGIRLPLNNLGTNGSLYEAVKEVTSNPKFQRNSKITSEKFRDRPVPPLDWAMYHIEYVIKHQGASHLRHSSLDLYWYQVYLLDVVAFVTCLISFCLFLLTYCLRKINFRKTNISCNQNNRNRPETSTKFKRKLQ